MVANAAAAPGSAPMTANPTGYRQLQGASWYRPFHQPLFSTSTPTFSARALKVMVWTDEAPPVGARLGLDVLRSDGTTLESIADVAWVDPQPAATPARFRLGLAVFTQTDPGLDELEQLLAD